MSSLEGYRRKRDPSRTPEPFGGRTRGAKPLFVIQRHDARRLHYDLRLERHGALASWAVPKGLPFRAGERHLAVHVEDHPLDYGSFEGEIPKGEYGAGTVEIWDRGTYELLEEKRDGGLTFRLDGERARGVWTLVAGAPRRQGAELAAAPQGRAAGGRTGGQTAARLTRRAAARGAGVALRAEVGRLPHDRHGRRRRRAAHEPERQGPHRAVQGGRPERHEGGADAVGGARRRGLRARRGRRRALRGAPARLRPARPDGVRPARARWGAGLRTSPARAPRAARGAPRPRCVGRPALAGVRGRRRASPRRVAHRVSRASSPSAPTCRTEPGRRTPEWRSSSSARRRTSRSSGTRAERDAGRSSARSSSHAVSRMASTGRATSARGSATTRSSGSGRCSSRTSGRRPRSPRPHACPASARRT